MKSLRLMQLILVLPFVAVAVGATGCPSDEDPAVDKSPSTTKDGSLVFDAKAFDTALGLEVGSGDATPT